jgi:hypothetical protein
LGLAPYGHTPISSKRQHRQPSSITTSQSWSRAHRIHMARKGSQPTQPAPEEQPRRSGRSKTLSQRAASNYSADQDDVSGTIPTSAAKKPKKQRQVSTLPNSAASQSGGDPPDKNDDTQRTPANDKSTGEPASGKKGDKTTKKRRNPDDNPDDAHPAKRLSNDEIKKLRKTIPTVTTSILQLQNDLGTIRTQVEKIESGVASKIEDCFKRYMPSGPKPSGQSSQSSRENSVENGIQPPPVHSPDVCKRWHWVERTQIAAICEGTFDIHNLPKLLRDDTARKRIRNRTVNGLVIPLDGGSIEFAEDATKLQSVFPTLQAFMTAFSIYISIRTTYAPAYAGPMLVWVERIHYYNSKGHRPGEKWPYVLNYIVDYFRLYQDASPEEWLKTDGELVSQHFAFSASPHEPAPPSLVKDQKSKLKPQNRNAAKFEQVCKNWNRPGGCQYQKKYGSSCPRLHQCWGCNDKSHTSSSCPTKPGLPPE